MKRICALLLIIYSSGLWADDLYYVIYPTGVGFINRQGEVVIEPIQSFNGGYQGGLNVGFYGIPLAVLSNKEDNKYHLLSRDGRWLYSSEKALVPASFSRVWEQIDETNWRLIDMSGKEYFKVDLQYPFKLGIRNTNIGYFEAGKAIVGIGHGCLIIDQNGDILNEAKYSQASNIWRYPNKYLDDEVFVGFQKDNVDDPLLYALQNVKGEVVYGPEEVWPVGPPSEGKVFMGNGYVDVNGKRGKAGSGIFYGHHYTEGLAAVIMKGRKDPDHFYAYYINHEGEIVIDGEELGITDARPFSDGLAAVSTRPPVPADNVRRAMDIFNYGYHMEGEWGAIDKDGNWVLEPKYPKPFRFDRGLALFKLPYTATSAAAVRMGIKPLEGYKYVYIDHKGAVIHDSFSINYSHFSKTVRGYEVIDPGFQFD